MHDGDFLKIEESQDGDVNLIHPDTGNCYHTIELEQWNEWERGDFSRVPSAAVEDPLSYVEEAVQIIVNNDIDDMSRMRQTWVNGVAYAQTKVDMYERVDR
jgi:hypothetical protein